MTRREAEAILGGFAGREILVVGDLMADVHIWGSTTRVSPEAPVLVVDVERETFVPGGAANVAHQLLAFGARVRVAGAVGADENGERLKAALAEMGANVDLVVTAPDRPTTTKTRIVAGAQQVVRVDREVRTALPEAVAHELAARTFDTLFNNPCDAVLFSDYSKGVLISQVVKPLITFAQEHDIPVTANPKPLFAKLFAGATLAQFNRKEADEAAGGLHRLDGVHALTSDETFHDAGGRLRKTLGVQNLLVTRGAEGMTVFTRDGGFFDVAPHRVAVFDPAGAGDSTLAGLTLALASGNSLTNAAIIGNAAGGAVVRKVGVATATPEEIAALFA